MSPADEAIPDLGTLLDRRGVDISSAWAAAAQRLPGAHYRDQPFEELRLFVSQGLRAITASLASGSNAPLDDYLSQVSRVRLDQGFDIGEVIQGLFLLRENALPVIGQAWPAGSPQAYEAILQLDTALRYMLGHFAHIYAEAMRASLKAQQERTELLLDVTQAASSSLELDQVLNHVAEAMLRVVRAPYCGIYLVDPQTDCLIPRAASGHPPPELEEAFRNRPLDPAQDIFVRALLDRREPVVSQDAGGDPRISPETARALGIKSVLAVPIKIGSRVLGAALATTIAEGQAFTREEIDLAAGVANAVALAVENASLFQQAERVAVMEERQRIARELHDSVAQSIYSITLYADTIKACMDAGDGSAAVKHLSQLRDTAREALDDMRLLVFQLRPPILEKEGLAAALQARLDVVEGRAGLLTELHVQGEPVLSPLAAEELYHTAQEALNNVLKHAQAQRVIVNLVFDTGMARLEICDDGVGFAPECGEEKGGLGLRGMRERAEHLGGELTVESAPGRGTRVRLVAPARSRL